MIKKHVYGAPFRSETSFPFDGGRSGSGCEHANQSPPRSTFPVAGEVERRRAAVFQPGLVAITLGVLLLHSANVFAQLKKVKVCTPGRGTASVPLWGEKAGG